MSKNKPIYDVYISYAPDDKKFAADVARILQTFDLAVFDAKTMLQGKRVEEELWEAMAESQALVVVLSAAEPSASTLFEFGAAQGWNKPVYVVVADPASARLPTYLRSASVYPFSRLEEVARAIKSSSDLLTDSEKTMLIEEYHHLGESVDELILQPALLSKLAKQFRKRARRQVASDELLRMLLRLRKRGELRPASKKIRAKVAK